MKNLLKYLFCTLFLAASIFAVGCADTETVDEGAMDEDVMADDPIVDEDMDQGAAAMVNLSPTEGNDVSGTVTFTPVADGIRVEANVTGLAPGMHGFHIHENGSCADNAQAAGGHFSPMSHPHGAPDADMTQRHVGDLGNIEAGDDGNATYDRVDSVVMLGGPNSVVGKAFVIHAGEDDLSSQPSGAAGARVACGIIEMADGSMMQDDADMDGTMEDGDGEEDGDM